MNSVQKLVLLVLVTVVPWSGTAQAQVPTLPPDGGTSLGGPTCATYDRELVASSNFRVGDELTVRGRGFPPNSLVLVSFRQLPREAELGRFKANEFGEFTSEPRIMRIPDEAVRGPAGILISADSASATCSVELAAAPASARRATATPVAEDEGNEYLTWWLILWALIVLLGGAGLALLRYRNWLGRRLERKISSLNGRTNPPAPPGVPPEVPLLPPVPPPPVSPWGPDDRPTLAATNDNGDHSPPILPSGWDAGREPIPVKFYYGG
ncbi:MAG TPA: hypothetical protein VFA34_04420 [Actinomycetota bacterium]|jgi:hypothetical protein|nr:hypothetical protein [Actinomycetota bacterium]